MSFSIVVYARGAGTAAPAVRANRRRRRRPLPFGSVLEIGLLAGGSIASNRMLSMPPHPPKPGSDSDGWSSGNRCL